MWAIFARIILRYRLLILILLGLFTAFMGFHAGDVKLNYGLPKMLPDDDPALITQQEFFSRFQSDKTVFVVGLEKNLFEDVQLFNEWYELGRRVTGLYGVDTVLSLGSAFNIVKDTANKRFEVVPLISGPLKDQRELDSLKNVFYNLPFYDNLLYSKKTGASLMAIAMNNSTFNTPERDKYFDDILGAVRQFEEEQQVDVRYSGLAFIRLEMTKLIKSELKMFIILALIVTVIILFLFFRSVKPVLISLMVVALGVVWSLGTMSLLGYEITILTGIIPPLIIVIGIPNCIYLINMFHAEFKKHGNKTKALVRVVSRIGKATFMTNATTAFGFFTFVFTQSTILVEFGLVAFINILLLFVASLLVITIMFSYMKPPKDSLTDHLQKNWIVFFIDFLIKVVGNYRKAVYVSMVIIAIVCAYGITLIETTGNIVDDLPHDHQITRDLKFFEQNFGGLMPFEVEIDAQKPRQILKTSMLRDIDQAQEYFHRFPEFSRSISIVDAMKFVRQSFYNGNPERYDLIDSRERAFFKDYIDNAGADKGLLDDYLDTTQQYARISVQIEDVATPEMDSLLRVLGPGVDSIFNPRRPKIDSALNHALNAPEKARDTLLANFFDDNPVQKRSFLGLLEQQGDSVTSDNLEEYLSTGDFNEQIKKAVDQTFTEISFTGPSVVFLKGTDYLVNNLFVSLAVAIVIVALLMSVVFSSFRIVFVTVITNLIPLLFTSGLMGFLGIPIKPSTILVFSIAFGISVDDAIHFLAKYRQELKWTGNDIGRSVRLALKETGVSMVYTSIILFFGFSVFSVSQFGGTQALGLLVSITLIVAMLSNLVVLPSILMSLERAMVTKSFQEPLLEIYDEEEDVEFDDDDEPKP